VKKYVFIIIALIISVTVYASSITKTLSFSEQDLNIQPFEDYVLVNLKGTMAYQVAGAPIVPVAIYNVLVPAGAEVTEINVISKQEYTIPGEYNLYPSQEPRPTGYQDEIKFTNPDASIYNSSQVYPEKLVGYSSTGTKSGYRIASFGVYPIRYIPKEKKLSLVTNLTIEINYEENKLNAQTLTQRQQAIFSEDVKSIVMNPEDINRFAPPLNSSDDNEIDCVIITNDALSTNFQPLIEWHNKKGLRTEVKTTSTIQTAYAGRDLQEKMRNFIIDYFNTRGLKWVILGGDNSVVPCRRTRSICGGYTGNIPCDLYYADLQWSWDGNNNSIFGEAGYDTVDFFADIFVGRLPVENTTELSNIMNKVFTYEKNPDPNYLKKMLLPASFLWSGYIHIQSQDTIANISPAGWTDRVIDLGTNDGYRYLVRDSLNAGFGLAHLVGHGDDQGIYINYGPEYYYQDPATQTNINKLAIVNSIACYPGNFETNDCCAEWMMNVPNCAVAVMMCSRYGWGTPPSIGPSELLDVRFFDFFFNQDSSFIGSCFSNSKDVYRYMAENQQVWRWCVYELNLFGDPVMPMWSDSPTNIQLSLPDSVQTGPQNLQVTVTRAGFPVSNAWVGIYKPGEVFARGQTNASGQVNISINAVITGTIYFTAYGENCLPKEDSLIVIQGTAVPYLILRRINPTQVNLNQTANVTLQIRNSGTATGSNIVGALRTANNYITMSDSVSNYGTLNAGDSSYGDGYSFFVSSLTPPGTLIPFTLALTADQGNWSYNFNIQAGEALPPAMIVADHDTGYCLLSVTAQGSIGYTAPNEKIGSGFRYPKSAISALYYCSMLAGNSASYVVDRFYGQPATATNQDWRVFDSLNFVNPPVYGDEHLRCSYTDAGHTTPQGLKVIQNSYMSADPRYDDFVVLLYDYINTSSTPITGLYSGIIADFDIPPDSSNVDIANSDATRRLVYMRRAANQNPTVGIELLMPTTAANLTAVDHDRYVYPDTAMTESMKYRILNGAINQPQSNRTYDWSVAVSTGPFNLNPTQIYRVAYALVGGSSESELFANADTAQAWFNRIYGMMEEEDSRIPQHLPFVDFSLTPNPTFQPLRISYNLLKPGKTTIGLYDISGQLKAHIFNGEITKTSGIIDYQLKSLPSGVYFVKLATGENTVMKKFLLVK